MRENKRDFAHSTAMLCLFYAVLSIISQRTSCVDYQLFKSLGKPNTDSPASWANLPCVGHLVKNHSNKNINRCKSDWLVDFSQGLV